MPACSHAGIPTRAFPSDLITEAPEEISYRGHFNVTVAGDPDRIASVVMLRSDHNTHSLTTGDRYVKLAFHQKGDAHHDKGDAHNGELRVRAPKLPAQAVPGIYMLFVVDKAGVPSVGQQGRLEPETHGDRRVFEHEDREDGIEAHSRTNDR